jgi:hypothetical protein
LCLSPLPAEERLWDFSGTRAGYHMCSCEVVGRLDKYRVSRKDAPDRSTPDSCLQQKGARMGQIVFRRSIPRHPRSLHISSERTTHQFRKNYPSVPVYYSKCDEEKARKLGATSASTGKGDNPARTRGQRCVNMYPKSIIATENLDEN